MMRRVALLLALILALSGCQNQTPTPAPPPILRGILSFGQTADSTLSESENRWFFSGEAGDIISLSVTTADSGVPIPSVTLLGANGEAIGRATAGRFTNVRLPTTGQYIIVVGSGTGKYTLKLERPRSADAPSPTPPPTPTSPPPGKPIRMGESVQGTIETGDAITLWVFEGQAGQVVTIRMEAQSKDLTPALRLLSPERALIASDDNPRREAFAQIGGVTLTTNGLYFLQTWGNGQIGQYTLTIMPGLPPPTANPTIRPTRVSTLEPTLTPTITPTIIAQATFGAALRIGEPVRGQFQQATQVDRFAVFVPAGAVISVGMFPDEGSPLTPTFDVFAPNGDKIVSATGVKPTGADVRAGGAIVSGFTVPVTGAYIIFARDAGAKLGGYTLTVGDSWTLREVGGGTALANQSYNGQLFRSGDRESWLYTLPANATISLEATAESAPFNPVLEIVGPNGAQLAAVRGGPGGTARVPSLVTAQAGIYRVRMTSLKNESAGKYTVILKQLNVQPTPTFSPLDTTLSGSVDQGGRYEYTFKAKPGDLVRIEVNADNPAQFDPVLELYSPSGRRIARADDIGAGNTDALLQSAITDETGDFRLVVFGYALMPGTFRIHVTVTPGP